MTLIRKIINKEGLPKSLKEKMLISSIWMYFYEFFNNGLLILRTIILARLLVPEQFGIVGIAIIITSTLEVFSNIGLQKGIIQKEVINKNHLNTVWTVSIIRGFILFISMFLLSPLIAEFFNTPRALPVLRVMSLCFIINGLNNVGIVYFSREFHFHKRVLQNGISILLGLIVTIYLAFELRNEWAIVFGNITNLFISMILSFVLHPFRPKLYFDYKIFKELFSFGKWVLFSAILIYITKQGDRIVLTKLLNVATLGIYIVAMRFASLLEIIPKAMHKVLFVAYSKLKNDISLLKKTYLRIFNIIVFHCVPICGITILVAKPAVLIFLGERWKEAIFPIQILTIAVLMNVITNLAVPLFYGYGKSKYTFNMLLVRGITLSILIYPLTQNMKINGVIYSCLLASLFTFPIWFIELKRLLNLKLIELSNFFISIITTTFSVLASHIITSSNSLNLLSTFLIKFLLGIIIYIIVNIIIHRYTKYKVLKIFIV